jgi:hypothetical protein
VGSPTVVAELNRCAQLPLAPFGDGFLDAFAKASPQSASDGDWDYVEMDPKASSNAAVMWNVDHPASDLACKPIAPAFSTITSAASSSSGHSSLASLDMSLSTSSSPLFMDLFAAEDISSGAYSAVPTATQPGGPLVSQCRLV